MNIRIKILIWFLVISIIPILLISVLFYQDSKKITEKLVVSKLIALADAKKEELDEWAHERIKDLKIIADNNDLETYLTEHHFNILDGTTENHQAPEHITAFISNLKEIFNYDKVYVTDYTGKVLVSTDARDEGKQVEKKIIDKTVSQKNIYIKDVYLSDNGRKIISFAGPIYLAHQASGLKKETEVVGILVFDINIATTIFPIINQQLGLQKSGEIVISRKIEDKIEFLNPLKYPTDMAMGLNEPKLLLPNLAIPTSLAVSGDEGVIRSLDYRGVEVVSVYRYLSMMNWGFVVKEDTSEAFSNVFELRNKIILISLFTIIFLIAVAIFVAKQITKRLQILHNEVEKIQQGNFDYEIKVSSNDEIGQLAQAFNRLLQFIKKSRKETEDKVLFQTEQIQKQDQKLNLRQKAILNVLSDIEVEKKSALSERDRVNIILQSIGDGVFVLDKHYRITIFNHSASIISGYSEEEALGKLYTDVLKFTFQVNNEINNGFITDAIEKGNISRMSNHTLLTRKDGTQIIVADSAAPIKNELGGIIGCVVVFRDATKEAEVDRMKTEFVSLASHQLNTPLTGIKWFLELLIKGKAGKLNNQQQEFLQNIEFSNNRMINLVADLLNISRIDSGNKFVIEKKNKDMIKILNDSIGRYAQLAIKKKVKVVIEKTVPAKMMVEVDESKIDQVFGNLISNAIKYATSETEIKIDFKETAKEIIFSFKNSGLGIPVDQQKRIFEKFFRADNIMTTDTEGNGLGLYIVKSIIEAHGGRVWFKSVENKTTTFYVGLVKG